MGAGRFCCVGFPVILAVTAIVTLLTASLSGITHQRLYLFRLNTENVSISSATIDNIADKIFDIGIMSPTDGLDDNVTAADLNLAKSYEINIFGFCWTDFRSNNRSCSRAKFDWASSSLNTTDIEHPGNSAQPSFKPPKELSSAMKAFIRISKGTQLSTVLALMALGIELLVGIFANCSRAVSCVTWLISSIAALLVGVAASLTTAQAAIVVGAVEATSKWYGAHGQINSGYLATVWFSFACALAAGLLWIFTICCCKPRRNR